MNQQKRHKNINKLHISIEDLRKEHQKSQIKRIVFDVILSGICITLGLAWNFILKALSGTRFLSMNYNAEWGIIEPLLLVIGFVFIWRALSE